MMKKILLSVFATIITVSILASFIGFKKLEVINCSSSEDVNKNSYLFTEWQTAPNRDPSYIECNGSNVFLIYRPLDIAVIGLIFIGITVVLARQKQ
jgi:hypothetical protein